MTELEQIIDKVFKEVIELYKPFDFDEDGEHFNKQDLQIGITLREFHQRIAKVIEQYVKKSGSQLVDYIERQEKNHKQYVIKARLDTMSKLMGMSIKQKNEWIAELKKGLK